MRSERRPSAAHGGDADFQQTTWLGQPGPATGVFQEDSRWGFKLCGTSFAGKSSVFGEASRTDSKSDKLSVAESAGCLVLVDGACFPFASQPPNHDPPKANLPH